MKHRPLLHLLLLALPATLAGQDAAVDLRKGDEAMAAGVWEMAALHYEHGLTTKEIPAAEKSLLAVRLAEAWIRDARPAQALEMLEKSFTRSHPEAPFWKAIALMGLGRLNDAAKNLVLFLANPAAPLRPEAAFTLTRLEIALNEPEKALATLSSLVGENDPAWRTRAQLEQVEILLDLGRNEEARATMPPAADIPQSEKTLATFLEAHLLLQENRTAEAAASFQSLVDQPQGQSLSRYHAAALALADALMKLGNRDAASAFLLTFIQDHPDSPQLAGMFERVVKLLPATPARTDPTLEKLAQWITPAEVPATGLVATLDSGAVGAWPITPLTSDLLAHALFARAAGLRMVGTPESLAEARRLLTRLRADYPTHPLTGKALLQDARAALAAGNNEKAFEMLESVRQTASTSELRGLAAFLEAQSAYSSGDKARASELFLQAAAALEGEEAKISRLNAAIFRLRESDGKSQTIAQTAVPEDKSLVADLELERALSKTQPAARRAAIEEFLTQFPEHPRVFEARLAAADAALATAPPDLSFARAQLDTLAADPALVAKLDPVQFALTRLRIQDIGGENQAAIATAREILEKHPGEPSTAEAALVLGRNLFQTASYNDARLVLEKLAATDTDPNRAQAAWLLAARSAALVPTSQSQQESLILFDKVIETKGSLAAIAKLEKARLMIDMNRLEEATAFLRKWFEVLPATDPLHLPAGLLLGEAIYAQGSVKDDSLTEALAVYDQLLAQKESNGAIFNRLQYLRGRTLEQIPDPKDPGRKREKEAFIAYYSVLETTQAPAEWHYFELCGFRALALLEKSQRWPAAIACARKIASFKGPRAEEASTRAAQLQLKHMIWEDN
ncbi:MAG: tetratricopeptide repeat protein [Akkermansiaceae bacterium]|nr:tetratricopeptide repeat protein [Akkermansiaceae bacterium]